MGIWPHEKAALRERPDYYQERIKWWNELDAQQQREWREWADTQGGVMKRGLLIFEYLEVVNGKGALSYMLHPKVHRAEAKRGDQDAQRFCDRQGIPWEKSDRDFNMWFAHWHVLMRQRVAGVKAGKR